MRIACVLDNGFEDSEFATPYKAFKAAGHDVTIIGVKPGAQLQGLKGKATATADAGIESARPDDYEALFIPGGSSPDHLRAEPRFLAFTRAFADADKPIFAICHGPQLLSSAEAIKGRRLTAWKTVQDDLRRMGQKVEDSQVVVDGQLVTSRMPDDLDAFVRESQKVLDRVPVSR